MITVPRETAATQVAEHHSVAALAEEWEELADRVGAVPFARPGWIAAWVAAFGGGAEPLILAAREGARVTGVLPLIGGGRVLRSPTNTHTPLFDMVAEHEDAARALAGEVARRRLRQLDLNYLDPAGSVCTAWNEIAGGARTLQHVQMRSPYVPLTGDFEGHRAGLDRRFRKDLDRRRRRLGELGELTFRFTDGEDDLDLVLDEGFQLEASGWKLEQGTAIVQDPARVAFYRGVARWAREQGWLTLAFAYLDGRPIAFDFCIEHGGSVYVLKGGYDPEYRKYGLGFLLIEETIRRAYALGLDSYELLGDADDYKLQLTSEVRDRVQLQTFGRGPAGRARKLGYAHVRPLVKRLRGG